MTIQLSTGQGIVTITEAVIATIVGASVSEVYGVIGMSSRSKLKDGVSELLKRETYTKGVIVDTNNNDISVQVHVILLYGVKISEVSQNIQERVKFALEQMLDTRVKEVSVIVEDVRVK